MKLDILAFGAHPDDVELGCGGTLIKEVAAGKKVGIIDLTYGDLGTRGTVEIRLKEAAIAAELMGLSIRENLGFRDGFFQHDEVHRLKVIEVIRKYCPEIVICNAPEDRHPDHGRAAELVAEAAFYAGLIKIETHDENGVLQPAWRPKVVYHYIQFKDLKPDFVVDISDFMEAKMKAILAHASQFYNPNSAEPQTLIASPEFLDYTRHRASSLGIIANVKYAEGFLVRRLPGVNYISDLL
jgi:bacillithiol biosynthesis deacetylase BshB1